MPDQNPVPEATPSESPIPVMSQQPVTPPVTPPPVFPMTPARSHGLVTLFSIIGAIVLLGGAGAAAAYYLELGPFKVQQYTEASFLSDIARKNAEVTSGSYTMQVSLKVVDRESDAKPFVVPPLDPNFIKQYTTDRLHLEHLSRVLQEIKYSRTSTKTVYPAKLPLSITKLASSTDFTYVVTEGGKNFALTATFLTDEAINAVKEGYRYSTGIVPFIDGKKVTFTQESDHRFYLSSSPPQPVFAELADMFREVSRDFSVTGGLAAAADFSPGSSSDWRLNFNGSGNFDDLSYQVDVDALKKNSIYYLRVNKIPALFFTDMLSGYKGKWISIDPKAATSTSGGFSILPSARDLGKIESEYKKNREEIVEWFQKLMASADHYGLVAFKSAPTRDSIDGKSLHRYDLTIRKEGVVKFYKDLLTKDENRLLGRLFPTIDQGTLTYLESSEFDTVFNYIKDNMFITVWTDRAGFVEKSEYRLRIVPPDTATQLKGKQLDFVVTASLDDINKGVKVDQPEGATPLDQVVKEIEANSRSRVIDDSGL